jgi:hypothetical protein
MSTDEQVDKFRWCAASLGASRIESIAEAVLGLDGLSSAAELAALLEPPP